MLNTGAQLYPVRQEAYLNLFWKKLGFCLQNHNTIIRMTYAILVSIKLCFFAVYVWSVLVPGIWND